MAFLWRVFCLTEGVYHFTVTPTLVEPTVCPTDAGPIDPIATVLVGLSRPDGSFPPFSDAPAHDVEASIQMEDGRPYAMVSTTTFKTVSSVEYPGTNIWEAVRTIFVLSTPSSQGSDDTTMSRQHKLRLFDVTNNITILETPFISAHTAPMVFESSAFTGLPIGRAVIEIQLKRTSGSWGDESNNGEVRIHYLRIESEPSAG